MKTALIISIIILSLFGVELEPNKLYEGGLKLTTKSLGVSFYLPPNWRGSVQLGKPFIMTHEKKLGYMRAERARIDTVVDEMLKDQDYNEEITFKSLNKPKRLRSTLYRINYRGRGIYRNYQGIGYIVLGPQDRVIKVFGVFKEENKTMMDNTMLRFVRSISFTTLY